jgi:hypothetical protein
VNASRRKTIELAYDWLAPKLSLPERSSLDVIFNGYKEALNELEEAQEQKVVDQWKDLHRCK